jgi:predicted transcriptional regulator
MAKKDQNPPKHRQDVTDAELAVLEVLWTAPGTIRGIRDKLYPGGGLAHYNTVQKLLERLEAKGFVSRDTAEIAHRFTAAVERDELIGRRLRAMADELCGGSLAPLISGLVRTGPLKAGEIDELRALIDRLDRKRRRK